MKRFLASLSLLLISPIAFKMPEMPEMPDIKTPEVRTEKSLLIYKDENCSQEGVNLSINQPICVKAYPQSTTAADATLTLLDSEKSELLRLTMTKVEDYYVAKLSTPQEEGVYYVHVEIKGEGLSFSAESNINVAGTQGEILVTTPADVQAKTVLNKSSSSAQSEDKNEISTSFQEVYPPQILGKLIFQLFRFLGKLLLF